MSGLEPPAPGIDPEEEPSGGVVPRVTPVVEAVPGVARVLGAAAWHTGVWGVKAYVSTGVRVAKAVVDPEERSALVRDTGEVVDTITEVARAVVGGAASARASDPDAAERVDGRRLRGDPHQADGTHEPAPAGAGSSPEALRRRGSELLERSRDVWATEEGHPAYARILDELAPDEARILLLLLQAGPQPSVDVRTGGAGGLMSSHLIAPGLSMIGARAGVRYPARVPAYLNNLFRLGLVWFSKESLRDPLDYQVLEAQPDVLDAVHSVRFAKVVRRSIHLTPFGEEFARMTLVEPEYGEMADFPEHAAPESSEAAEPPAP